MAQWLGGFTHLEFGPAHPSGSSQPPSIQLQGSSALFWPTVHPHTAYSDTDTQVNKNFLKRKGVTQQLRVLASHPEDLAQFQVSRCQLTSDPADPI